MAEDAKSMARAVIELFEDETMRKSLIFNAGAKAEKFDLDIVKSEWIRVLEGKV
jgi:glycosyltransferase involved in cell wall biosynthesis